MLVNGLEAHPQLQECSHIHHPQHASNAKSLGAEDVQWNAEGLEHLESNKVDKRVNNCMNNGKNSDIIRATSEQIEGHEEESQTLWQRIKWTDEMAKLLITAVAYVGHYVNLSRQNKNQMKGKWRAISNVMVQRGYLVSPQQCEDKFNDLNKKYKRLNEVLGKGTACDVVENPSILDSMNLSDEAAGEVIKILSSKQLFYQEMCSYHNGTRLFLPHDEDLEQSLHLAFKGKDQKKSDQDLIHEKISTKRMREGEGHGAVVLENGLHCNDKVNSNCPSNLGRTGEKLPNERWITYRFQKLEEQRVKIEEQRSIVEKKRLKWYWYCQHEDWKLEKMRLENKLMKLQNQSLDFEIESHKQGRKL